MSPDEILADLRDIHPPQAPEHALTTTFAPEPFYVLAVILGLLALHWWRGRTRWRREACRALVDALAEPEPGRRWHGLIHLLQLVARHRHAPAPESLFLPPERIGEAEIDALAQHIRRLIGGGGRARP